MSGNRSGGKKAAVTNTLRHGGDFYRRIGSRSWSDPARRRDVGFANLSPEQRKELGRRGGLKTKKDYKTASADKKVEEETQEGEQALDNETEELGTGASE